MVTVVVVVVAFPNSCSMSTVVAVMVTVAAVVLVTVVAMRRYSWCRNQTRISASLDTAWNSRTSISSCDHIQREVCICLQQRD